MGSIFDGILRNVFTDDGGHGEEWENALKSGMREALFSKIAKSIADFPMIVKCEHKAGTDNATTEIKGHPVAIMLGMHKLLTSVALTVCDGDKKKAIKYIRHTCKQVTNEILSGRGIEDAQDTTEKAED